MIKHLDLSVVTPSHNAQVHPLDPELEKAVEALKAARVSKLNGSISFHCQQGIIRKIELKDVRDINDLK